MGLHRAEFAINTAAGSLAYPVFLGLCQRLPAFSLLETDRFAALVCGACFVGAGVGVTLRPALPPAAATRWP